MGSAAPAQMLERAVASLEAAQLPHAIRRTRRPLKTPRQLHTGFWQHGASALALASILPLAHLAESRREDVERGRTRDEAGEEEPVEPKLVATSFLLDFLYPDDTKSFLHKLLAPRPRASRLRPLRRRQYSAQQGAAVERSEPAMASNRFAEEAPTVEAEADEHTTVTEAEAVDATQNEGEIEIKKTQTDAKADAKTEEELLQQKFLDQFSSRITAKKSSGTVDDWTIYRSATAEEQKTLRPELIVQFSKSGDHAECTRATALFREIPKDEWTEELVSAAMRSFTFCGKISNAMDLFKEGLAVGYLDGMQYILSTALTARKFQDAFQAWFAYLKIVGENTQRDVPFEQVTKIHKVDRMFTAFERHVKHTGLARIRSENKQHFSIKGFQQLRRLLARCTLAKHCQPSQALPILTTFNDVAMYQDYLESILDQIREGKLAKGNTANIDKVYNQYRQLPDAQFTQRILRGLFNLFYPHDAALLSQLFQDWDQTKTGLDSWAYTKFLGFYAYSGDIAAVKDLWKRYTADFPDATTSPTGYYSLLEAHAQCGDVAGAQKVLTTIESFGIDVDITIRNKMLQCQVQAGNFKQAKTAFAEIQQIDEPNSETYDHILELYGSRGDLETTAALFNEAQTVIGLPTKSMAKSLIAAYVRGGYLEEGEQMCRELARRNITSTEIWNELLRAHATDGHVRKCYGLLSAMQNHGLAWDHDTCEAVLTAQTQAGKLHAARRLLRSAVEDSTLPVSAAHFAIVMKSAIDTEQPALVDILDADMQRADIRPSFATHLAKFASGYARAPTADRTVRLANELLEYMRTLAHDSTAALRSRRAAPFAVARSSPAGLERELRGVSDAVSLLIGKREVKLAEELITLYIHVRPDTEDGQRVPPSVIAALMGAHMDLDQHDRVLQLWALLLGDVRAATENPTSKTIFPIHAYYLSDALGHVAKVYRAAGEGKRLLDCTEAALAAGFRLTSETWNAVVCGLADLGQWEPAMAWCEALLMPRWRGWAEPRRRPRASERAKLRNPRILSASRAAVLSLQREWLRLRRLAAWSPGVAARLRRVEADYPLLHHAFETADLESLPETWAAEERDGGAGPVAREMPTSLNKAIMKDMLGTMALKDLLAVRLALTGEWNAERERREAEEAAARGGRAVKRGLRRRF